MSNSDQKSKYGAFLIVAVILIFATLWGPGSQGCDTRIQDEEHAATVNGSPIPLREFRRAYAQQSEQYRRQGVPADLLKQFGIHKQVLDSLVNRELLAQAAEARGLRASDYDLKKLLTDIPAFKGENGKFSKEQYQAYVRQVEGSTEPAFEAKLRRDLAAQKLLELVENSVAVSDEEVKAKYLKDGDQAKVTFVRFTPAMYTEKIGTPKAAEIEAWAKQNEALLAAHYEQNKFSYFEQEKVKAKQILLRVPPDADAAKKAEIKQRAENTRKQIVDEKKDFSEVAKAVSEDLGTREKGGDLGLVDRLSLPNAFADALFAIQPNEVTAPIETPAGWFIGTVTEKVAPRQKTLDEVRKEIAEQLYVKEKAKALAQADAQKALADVKAGKSLTELFPASGASEGAFAAEVKPEAKETGEFSASADAIPQLGPDAALKKAIFDMKAAGAIDQLLPMGDAFVVATVDERKLPSDDAFAKDKDQLKLEAIKGKQFEVRESYVKALKQSGSVVTNDPAVQAALNDT